MGDTHAFARALASHRHPGLKLRTDIIAGEDRRSVAPALLTCGPMWALAGN